MQICLRYRRYAAVLKKADMFSRIAAASVQFESVAVNAAKALVREILAKESRLRYKDAPLMFGKGTKLKNATKAHKRMPQRPW